MVRHMVRRAIVVAALVSAAAPAGASAAAANFSKGYFAWHPTPDAASRLTIQRVGNDLVVRDDADELNPRYAKEARGCKIRRRSIACPIRGLKLVSILAGNGGAVVRSRVPPGVIDDLVLQGGTGNDLIVGSDANETILAGRGRDTVRAGGGDDGVDGGAGGDRIDCGDGEDSIRGAFESDVRTACEHLPPPPMPAPAGGPPSCGSCHSYPPSGGSGEPPLERLRVLARDHGRLVFSVQANGAQTVRWTLVRADDDTVVLTRSQRVRRRGTAIVRFGTRKALPAGRYFVRLSGYGMSRYVFVRR